jgi:hypothetical protein
MAMLGGLTSSEVPDGNTLFNVAERLGGSIGIALLTTFFTTRLAVHVNAVLAHLGIPAGNPQLGAGTATHVPPPIATQLGQAALDGFHDTIWLLVVLAVLGCLAALLLRGHAVTGRPENNVQSHIEEKTSVPA